VAKNHPKTSQLLSLYLNILLRTILPLYIFINPLVGIFIAIITDLIDHEILVRWQKMSRHLYQLQDKYLDQFWYFLIIIFLFINQAPPIVNIIVISTFLYRIVGQILFVKSKNELYFLIFPNLMEPYFWLYILYPNSYQNPKSLLNWTIIILTLKLYQEYFIHISKSSLLNNLLNLKTKK
jgi:hypothetical protein